jgi:hypothetical protein
LILMLLTLKRPLRQKLVYIIGQSHLNEVELMVHKFGFIHVVHCICRLIVMYFILSAVFYEQTSLKISHK